MKRRLAAVAAIGLSAALGLSACSSSSNSNSGSGSGGSASGPITIHFFGADYGTPGSSNSTQTYWQGIADAFHKANPNITVDIQTIGWTPFPQKIQTMIQAHDIPDIIEGDSPQTYAANGIAYQASDVLSAATLSDLIPAFKQEGFYKGTQYGIPFTTSTRVLCYNTKLFKQANIASPPSTWADLKTDAQKIQALGNSTIGYGFPMGPEEAQAESYMWMLGAQGGYANSSGSYTFNSAANVTALNFANSLVTAGVTEAKPGTVNRADIWNEFAAGQVGMAGCSTAIAPIIQTAGKLQTSDWAMAPFPGQNGPLTNQLGVTDQITVTNYDKTSGAEAADRAFLDFAFTAQYQAQFDQEYDLLPATTSGAAALASNPLFAASIKNIPTSSLYPTAANWGDVSAKYKQTAGAAFDGASSPSAMLGQMQTFAQTAN